MFTVEFVEVLEIGNIQLGLQKAVWTATFESIYHFQRYVRLEGPQYARAFSFRLL